MSFATPPVLSILHATRRGREALATQLAWISLAGEPSSIEWLLAVDEDDAVSLAALEGKPVLRVKTGGGPVAAWNEAARASQGKILLQMSDDWLPVRHWDILIRERLKGREDEETVLRISDGHRADELMCMAILTRRYHDRYGYLFHPDYFSMHSDTEFSLQAKRDGVIIDASDVIFQHDHPLFTGKPMDDVYRQSNSPERHEQGLKVLKTHLSALVRKSNRAV